MVSRSVRVRWVLKIMAQEWKQEYSPEQLSLISELKNELSTWRSQEDLISICNDLHQATVQNQKYLWVHLFTDTEFPQSSAAYQLHKLVADLHCQVTEEIVEWYEPGKARIKGRLQTEHLDGIKDNNSIHNLHHTTGTLNTRMIGVPVSEKRWEYENYCPIGRLRDMQDSLKQMEPWGTVN